MPSRRSSSSKSKGGGRGHHHVGLSIPTHTTRGAALLELGKLFLQLINFIDEKRARGAKVDRCWRQKHSWRQLQTCPSDLFTSTKDVDMAGDGIAAAFFRCN